MQPKLYGPVIGIVLGFAWAFGGFGRFAIVVVFGLIGWVVAKVIEGDLDPIDYLSSRSKRERG
jgi:hypothetical protein